MNAIASSPIDPPQFAYGTLGSRLMAALDREPGAQTIVKNLLCASKLPATLPRTILDWMKAFPSTKPLHEEFVRGHCRLGPVPATPVALGPLLVWGFKQDWAHRIQWEFLLKNWSDALMCKGPVQSLAYVAHALHVFEPIMHDLTPHQKLRVCNIWRLSGVVWGDLRWTRFANSFERQLVLLRKNNSISYVHDMVAAWAILGTLAHSISSFPRTDRPTVLTQWYKSVSKSLYTLDVPHQTVAASALLQSTLPADVRWKAACLGDCQVVNDPQVRDTVLALMPLDEMGRFPFLPWAYTPDGKKSMGQNKSSMTYMPHEAATLNKGLLQTYCPMLYNTIGQDFSKAWSDPGHLHRLANSVTTFPCEEGIALPMDLDSP